MRIRVVLIVLASLALADCGGGGGGGGAPALPTVPPKLTNATISGTLDHGNTVTISGGSAFGVKSRAEPLIADGAGGANILAVWSGSWPRLNATYNTEYRNLQNGVNPPHARANNRYIAGAHYASDGADGGYAVMFWKNRTITSYPAYTYASWYQRMQDNWTFGLGSPNDNNLKMWDYSVGTEPYNPNNWYIEYNPQPTSAGSGAGWNITDDGNSLQFPVSSFGGSAINPMSGVWTKIEVEIKYTNQSDGYIKLWENGTRKISYAGRTDNYPGTARSESIGGYARSQGSANNWRYFSEVYFDHTPARVVLTDSPTFGSANIVETQIPTAWSDTSITFGVNLGKFTTGHTAYLFVVNTAGLVSSPGLAVTVGQ